MGSSQAPASVIQLTLWLCSLGTGAAWALYIGFMFAHYAREGTVSLLPFEWSWVLAIAGGALVTATVVLKIGVTLRAKPVAEYAQFTVPGLTSYGAFRAMLNIRDRSHRVTWSNFEPLGRIAPTKRGGGFDVVHDELGHVGEAPTVKEGLMILESVEILSR